VKVYDGFDGTELTARQFDAFPNTNTDGVSVAVGDVNGDGYADIVVGAGMYGTPYVLVKSGKDGTQLAKFTAYSSGLYGVRVAVGDVNGDGKADIITAPMTGTNPVHIYDGATFKLLRSITPFGSFSGGLFVAAGDLDGDGKAEVIVSQDGIANAKVRIFNGNTGAQIGSDLTPFAGVSPQPQGARIMVVDRDGDGKADIVVGSGPNGNGRIRTFKGTTLQLLNEITPFASNFLGGVYVG
jgi:serralysin